MVARQTGMSGVDKLTAQQIRSVVQAEGRVFTPVCSFSVSVCCYHTMT
jgi:hypothetical protein